MNARTHTRTHTDSHMHAHTHTHTHRLAHACTHTHAHTQTCTCTHIHTRTHTDLHMHAHTHAHTQTRTCTHMHTTKTQVASCNSLLACLCCCVCVTSFRAPIHSLACWFCTSALDSDISLENWQNVPVSMCFWWQTPLKNWNFKSTTAEIILYYTRIKI